MSERSSLWHFLEMYRTHEIEIVEVKVKSLHQMWGMPKLWYYNHPILDVLSLASADIVRDPDE